MHGTSPRSSRSCGVAKVLIQNGADVNAVDKYNWLALHFAAQKGYVDVAKALIQNGADVNAVDEEKHSALYFAAREEHDVLALDLLCFGAEIDAAEKLTDLLGQVKDRVNLLRLVNALERL